jgi:hypothetical protein|tara:strand:+ start:308 stop:1015 length:708 start_codon:yes stop_codon:yes gene_type:complete
MRMVFTPDWFLNNDVLIEIISFMVLFLFFLFSVKCYNANKKKSILYLGFGFLLIAMGELSTILTKLVLYYDTGITREIGQAVMTSQIVETVDIFYYLGFFFNRFLTLLGLYIIYKIPAEKKLSTDFFLIIYLLLVTAFLSNSIYYIYHLTALILLVLIIRNYYRIYLENNLSNTKILITSFSLMLISQTIFLFAELNFLYITAKVLQLVSYITLLILIVKILKNGKKEKPHRHTA